MLLMRASTSTGEGTKDKQMKQEDDFTSDLVPPWRNGPAKMWYDKMNLPTTVGHFDYGFKTKTDSSKPLPQVKEEEDEERFLPVNLIRWEDDIIYDGENIRDQVCY